MSSVLTPAPPVQPTRSAPLVRLLAYTQRLGLEPYLDRRKRGLSTLVLSLVWLILAWQGSGRPHHLRQLADPCSPPCSACPLAHAPDLASQPDLLLSARHPRRRGSRLPAELPPALGAHLGRARLAPGALLGPRPAGAAAQGLVGPARSRAARLSAVSGHRYRDWPGRHLSAAARRRAGPSLYRRPGAARARTCSAAAWPGSWPTAGSPVARPSPRCCTPAFRSFSASRARPACGRGWRRSRASNGAGSSTAGRFAWAGVHWDARLQLLALSARHPTDGRGPWVYVTSIQGLSPGRLAALYRQRWRVEQAIDEWSTARTSIIWSPPACIPTASPSASNCSPATWPSASSSTRPRASPTVLPRTAGLPRHPRRRLGAALSASRLLWSCARFSPSAPNLVPPLDSPSRPLDRLRPNCDFYARSYWRPRGGRAGGARGVGWAARWARRPRDSRHAPHTTPSPLRMRPTGAAPDPPGPMRMVHSRHGTTPGGTDAGTCDSAGSSGSIRCSGSSSMTGKSTLCSRWGQPGVLVRYLSDSASFRRRFGLGRAASAAAGSRW